MAIIINLIGEEKASIKTKRGDSFILQTMRFWTDEAKTIPLDITNYTFAMEVKDTDGNIILSFTMASGFTIQNTNELVVSKTAEEMLVKANEDGETYFYDLESTDDNDVVKTIIGGTFFIENDITNNA